MVHSPESLFVFAAPASSLESTHSAKILAHPTIPGVVRSLGRIQAVMVARSRPPRHLFSPTSLEPRRVGSALPYRCDRWSDRVCVPGETKGTPRAGAGGVFISMWRKSNRYQEINSLEKVEETTHKHAHAIMEMMNV